MNRVWMISYGSWQDDYRGVPEYNEDLLIDYGFFLLEADALVKADELNKPLLERYVRECQANEQQHRIEMTAHEEGLRRNQLLRDNGFAEVPVPKVRTYPSLPSFAKWRQSKQESFYEPVEVLPGS